MKETDRYILTYDHHTHTVFSHGKGTIEDNVKMAAAKGLRSVAISDHGPGHLTYGVKRERISEMRHIVDELNVAYPQMEILLSIEANIVDRDKGLDLMPEDVEQLDFVIAGYHYGVRDGHCIANWRCDHNLGVGGKSRSRLLKSNTDMMLRAIYENNIRTITHPGDKGPFDIAEIAKACVETDTMMEINAKHRHLTIDEIRIAARYDVKFILGSDAHVPEAVGSFMEPLQRALGAGLDPSRIVNIKEREEQTCS